jgi:hypothetical protein
MRGLAKTTLILALLVLFSGVQAYAGHAALLLEEPYGKLGALSPTGHAAVYLSDVCADTPTHLRRCDPGEAGVVLSRYHHIDGYDWIAMPLIPYLYAVDSPLQIPASVDEDSVLRLRDRYRRNHLMELAPDQPGKQIPGGGWTELVGEAYNRKIYGFAVETRPEQDDALIAALNDSRNHRRFNLFFSNCADFAQKLMNFYYPHSVRRNFIADAGLLTPKQAARSFTHYARRHPDLTLNTFVIAQVPGSMHRSTSADGIVESLVKSKKYVLPIAVLHPIIAAGLIVAYLGEGRFHPDPNAVAYDPLGSPEAALPVSSPSYFPRGPFSSSLSLLTASGDSYPRTGP